MLNPQKGNMYAFVTHTFNPIKGQCEHDCRYCYMKKFKLKPVRFVESELQTSLGTGNFIFVGSSTDMFAESIPSHWIYRVLDMCRDSDGENYGNKFLFQSKNPARFQEFIGHYPRHTILGTTIESNRNHPVSLAPSVRERMEVMKSGEWPFLRMVTIEPIMEFDLDILVSWIREIGPKWVNIGADSKGHNLPEPTRSEVSDLVNSLREFTEVKVKANLKRLIKSTTHR